ncbi:putative phage protein (TIGR02218 family) [Oxalobacteraceae bacterium GrIS 1.11]
MRDATPRLVAILDSATFVKCNLFHLTLASGIDYFWTDADVDIVANGRIYDSGGPSIQGAKYNLVRGMQVSTLELRVLVAPKDLIAGVPWFLATRSGALKNAEVVIEKAFMPAWGQPAETLGIFRGYVNESADAEQEVTLSVVSDSNRLNTQIPRAIFQAGCMRTLYDAGCGLPRASYSVTSTAQAVPNRYSFAIDLPQPDGYFSLGELIFTSGPNAGVRRSVKAHRQGMIELSYPLVFDLAAGDSFIVRAGCDRTRGPNGCAKFGNLANFKGTPYIPPPEVAV